MKIGLLTWFGKMKRNQDGKIVQKAVSLYRRRFGKTVVRETKA